MAGEKNIKSEKWTASLSAFFNASSRDAAEILLGDLYAQYDQDIAKIAKIELPAKGSPLESLKKAMLFQFWAEKKPEVILPELLTHLENALATKDFDSSVLSAIVYVRCVRNLKKNEKEEIRPIIKNLIKDIIKPEENDDIKNSILVEGLVTLNYVSSALKESDFYIDLIDKFPQNCILQLFQNFGYQAGWDGVHQDKKDAYCRTFENFIKDRLDQLHSSAGLRLAVPFIIKTMNKLNYTGSEKFKIFVKTNQTMIQLPLILPKSLFKP